MACLTEKGDFFVLSWDASKQEIVTIIHANVNSPDCLPTRTSQLLSIDLNAQLVIIHVSVGMLQLLSFEVQGQSVQFRKAVPLKVMELEIVDLSFVDAIRADSGASATLAVLNRVSMKMARVKVYELTRTSANNFSFQPVNYAITELTSDVIGLMRVSQPRGGFLIYSPERIIYTNPQANIIRKLVFSPTFFTCCCAVDGDGFRFLFGSSSGEIYISLLVCDGSNKVSQVKFERLGRTAVPSCLTYVDDGCVYVGSNHGDSSLIQLRTEAVKSTGNYFSTLQTFPSLAPMTDFIVTRPNSASEQSVLIGAGGSAHEGSLKRLCSGLEVNCLLSLDLECDFKATRLLSVIANGVIQQFVLSSPFGQSLLINFNPTNLEVFEEGCMSPLNPRSETLCLFNFKKGAICQVTPESAFLTNVAGDKINQIYSHPEAKIIHASNCGAWLAAAFADGSVSLFPLEGVKPLIPIFTKSFPTQLASLALVENSNGGLVILFSLWDNCTFGMIAFDAEGKNEQIKTCQSDAPIRSAAMLGKRYALFGSGDGRVFVIDTSAPTLTVECIKMGKLPITLYSIPAADYVLAHSIQETFHISVLRGRIVHSVVLGLPRDIVLSIAPGRFETQSGFYALQGSCINFYVMAKSVIPRVNISSHPVGQSVHRLCEFDGCLVTLEHNFPVLSVPMSHWPLMRSKLTLRDLATLEVVDTFAFEHGDERGRFAEIGWCCSVGELRGVEGKVLVVGTCIASDDAKIERGRLLLFQLAEGKKLKLISCNEFSNGGVKAATIVRGAVLAAIRGANVLFKWDYAIERRLVKASSSGGHIEGTAFDVQENIVVSGDALTSLAFCSVNAEQAKIIEFARDFQDNYITSVQLVDYASALAADLTGNLLLVQVIRDESLNLNAAVIKGNIHVADMINTLRRADFLSRPAVAQQSFLAASAGGALYAIHQLNQDTFKLLFALQKNLVASMQLVGGVKHGEFRRFFNGERTLEKSIGFIDGDLVSKFLALPPAKQTEAMGMTGKSNLPEKITEISKDDLSKLIESFSYGI